MREGEIDARSESPEERYVRGGKLDARSEPMCVVVIVALCYNRGYEDDVFNVWGSFLWQIYSCSLAGNTH